MAVEAKYTSQFPVVATPTQRRLVEEESNAKGVSMARVVGWAVDAYYGLTDGEETSTSSTPVASQG